MITADNDQPAALSGELDLERDGLAVVSVRDGDEQVATVAIDFTAEHDATELADGLRLANRHAVRH